MRTEILVKFAVEFIYRPAYSKPYTALIAVSLPTNEEGYLLDCLQSDGSSYLLYERTNKRWGVPNQDRSHRTAETEKATAISWQELVKIVDEYLTEVKNDIQATVSRYDAAVNKTPQPYQFTCSISPSSIGYEDYGYDDEEG